MRNSNDTTLNSLQKIASSYGVTLNYLLKHIERPDRHPIDGVAMEATFMVDMDTGTYTGRYSRSATIVVLQAEPVQRTLDKQSFNICIGGVGSGSLCSEK